ncbi:MAG: hypothetical protein ACRBK7_14645 [Acidimicrobiales bacterium]
MADKIPPRFRKTKTEKWAVMAPIEDLEKALAEGGKIDVQKKSGDWSSFVVGSLGKPFDVDGVQMCYGYAPGDEDTGQGSGSGASSGSGSRSRSDSGPAQADWRPDNEPPQSATAVDYHRDPSEPMPEYQGGADDEWAGS